jgi:hypothetical protein
LVHVHPVLPTRRPDAVDTCTRIRLLTRSGTSLGAHGTSLPH